VNAALVYSAHDDISLRGLDWLHPMAAAIVPTAAWRGSA